MPIDIVSNFVFEVSEQIIILRIQSERKYYIGQALFLAALSGMVTVLSLCYPVIDYFLTGKMLFTRNIQPSDMIGGFLLMFASSFVGCMMGGVFSQRVIKKRETGMILTIICALISVVRIGIVDEAPIMRYILWMCLSGHQSGSVEV